VRSFVEIRALISEDDEQLDALLKGKWAIDDASSSTFSSHRQTLVAAQADYAVPFGAVTDASIVLILAYQDIEVKLDGIGQASIPISALPAVVASDILSNLQRYDQPGLFLLTGSLSSIHVTNPSSTETASFYVALVGEAS